MAPEKTLDDLMHELFMQPLQIFTPSHGYYWNLQDLRNEAQVRGTTLEGLMKVMFGDDKLRQELAKKYNPASVILDEFHFIEDPTTHSSFNPEGRWDNKDDFENAFKAFVTYLKTRQKVNSAGLDWFDLNMIQDLLRTQGLAIQKVKKIDNISTEG